MINKAMIDNKLDVIEENVMEGIFMLDVVEHSTGIILDHYEERNVIVVDAKEAIIYAISQSELGHIKHLKVGDDIGSSVNVSGTPDFTFLDSGTSDTITRSAGSWVDDGFIDEMTLTITGSVSNNGVDVYTIASVTPTTLTLSVSSAVTNEGPTSAPTIVGNPSNNNPIAPTENFNASSMSVIHYPTDPLGLNKSLSIGYSSATSTTFSLTIVGAEVLADYPTETTKIITSAALHSANGNVFAYKRYPQKSISELVDINISWTIQY